MKKLFAIIAIILLIPAFAYARSAESSVEPNRLQKSRGKVLYRYNIQTVQEDMDGDGTADTTMWRYDEVIIEPPATKAKILAAIRDAESSTQTADIEALESERTAAQQKLAVIADMSYSQVDSYIDNNVADLASAKVMLKKLAKAIVAISKQLDL